MISISDNISGIVQDSGVSINDVVQTWCLQCLITGDATVLHLNIDICLPSVESSQDIYHVSFFARPGTSWLLAVLEEEQEMSLTFMSVSIWKHSWLLLPWTFGNKTWELLVVFLSLKTVGVFMIANIQIFL